MNHRCRKLDMLLGKRLHIIFSDGGDYAGQLIWDTEEQTYKLKNCVDMKRGFMVNYKSFRKSQASIIERI